MGTGLVLMLTIAGLGTAYVLWFERDWFLNHYGDWFGWW